MPAININSQKGRWILVATVLASGMSFLLTSAVSVAVPAIQTYFGADLGAMQWVLNAFTLALASLLLLAGSLGDHFGRKRVFLYGIFVFGIGATLSGFAASAGWLIALQALMGVGAAMMVPGSLAIIHACLAEEHQGRAIGLWAGLSGAMAAIGPFAGGWLVDVFGWQSIFFANVPLAVLVFVVAWLTVPETYNPEAGRLDIAGTALVVVGLLGLSFGLVQGPAWGWASLPILTSLVGGTLAFVLLVLIERRISSPVLPVGMFKDKLVTGANIATLFIYFALNGTIFLLVLNLQQVQGLSATHAGLGLLPLIGIIALFSGSAGTLSDRIGPRKQMVGAPLLIVAGLVSFLFAGTDANYWVHFFPGLVFIGAGMALVIAPLTKSALHVQPKYSGVASGVNNAAARVAALLAIAVLGAVAVSVFGTNLREEIQAAPISGERTQEIMAQSGDFGGLQLPAGLTEAERISAREAVNSSFVTGFNWAIGLGALLAFLASAISFVMIRKS